LAKFESAKKPKTPLQSFDQTILTMFEKAVEKGDPDRHSLILTVIDALQVILFRRKIGTQVVKPLIENQIEQLDRMFRIIVAYNDFELFRSAIDMLTVTLSHDVSMLAGSLEERAWKAVGLEIRSTQTRKDLERLLFTLKYSGQEFDRILQLGSRIDDLQDESAKKPGDKDWTAYDILELYENLFLCRLSFLIVVNLLFEHKQATIDTGALIAYLVELWHHTNPDDAEGMTANVTPVATDTLLLTLLYLYGGVNSSLWFEGYYFRGFHGTSKYITQSYLLGLAKAAARIPTPSESEIKKYYELEMWDELRGIYEVAQRFVSETSSNDFQKEVKEFSESKLGDFITRKRPMPADLTWQDDLKQSIDEASKGFQRAKELISSLLPLDSDKVSEFVLQVKSAYNESSLAQNLGRLTPCAPENLSSLETFAIKSITPRESFIKESNVVTIWSELGRVIAAKEMVHAYHVASNLRSPSLTIERYDPEQLWDAVRAQVSKLKERKAEPNLAFVPLALITDWRLRHFDSIAYDKGEVLHLPESDLRLVNSSKRFDFQDILILDSNMCQWLYEPFDESRLKCSVVEIASQSDKVEVGIESRGLFVPMTEGVDLIKLREVRKL
jgi:hypothetical protein